MHRTFEVCMPTHTHTHTQEALRQPSAGRRPGGNTRSHAGTEKRKYQVCVRALFLTVHNGMSPSTAMRLPLPDVIDRQDRGTTQIVTRIHIIDRSSGTKHARGRGGPPAPVQTRIYARTCKRPHVQARLAPACGSFAQAPRGESCWSAPLDVTPIRVLLKYV